MWYQSVLAARCIVQLPDGEENPLLQCDGCGREGAYVYKGWVFMCAKCIEERES
jgi:hypothetical protein